MAAPTPVGGGTVTSAHDDIGPGPAPAGRVGVTASPHPPDAAAALRESMSRPNAARIYDYLLGGASNYAVDREFAKKHLASFPDFRHAAVENRAFLRRAVRHAVASGVLQFLDIGAGLPTHGAVHEVAETEAPALTRTVYVDIDPVATAHAEYLLAGTDRAAAVAGDIRRPDTLWRKACDTGLLDPDAPVCVLTVALLHFLTEPGPPLAWLRDRVALGSLLALSHACDETDDAEMRAVAESYGSTDAGMTLRARPEIAALFGDFELREPGLVWTPEWRPEFDSDTDPRRSRALCGVAAKTARR